MKALNVIVMFFLLISCSSLPESIQPVSGFDLKRYSGKWYEIARLDHRFERGLEQVTATYSVNSDGSVRVENRGFSIETEEWENAVGKARFAGNADIGQLEVSFFGPFYGSYVIFELDEENYQYSFVTGSENSLWFLSRTSKVSDELKVRFIEAIKAHGYNPDELIFVRQE